MSKLRISIAVGPCFPVPALRGGGMIRAWMALGSAFAGAGHMVTLLAREYPGQAAIEKIDGFQVIRWGGYDQPSSTWVSLLKDFSYAIGLCRRLPQADILVTNDFWLPVVAPMLRPGAGRVVVSVNRFPKQQLVLYRKASLLVVPTAALVDAVRSQFMGNQHRVCRIPNPIDGRIFRPGVTGECSPFSILYVGRIHPEKGLHLLIAAFRILTLQVPECRLSLVGPSATVEGGGGEEYAAHLREEAAGLSVNFLGAVHNDESLARLYQTHAIFCYPSLADRGESMGIAPIEAMACGCVPVVSSNPVFDDWLKPGENGLRFDHHARNAAELLASTLLECVQSPERLAELSMAARISSNRYQARSVCEEFLQQFELITHESY